MFIGQPPERASCQPRCNGLPVGSAATTTKSHRIWPSPVCTPRQWRPLPCLHPRWCRRLLLFRGTHAASRMRAWPLAEPAVPASRPASCPAYCTCALAGVCGVEHAGMPLLGFIPMRPQLAACKVCCGLTVSPCGMWGWGMRCPDPQRRPRIILGMQSSAVSHPSPACRPPLTQRHTLLSDVEI